MQCGTLGFGEHDVRRLNGEFSDTLQVAGDRADATLGRLHQGDTIAQITYRGVEAADLRGKPRCNDEAGGIISGAVDAQTRGEPLNGLGELTVDRLETALGRDRIQIRIDDDRHRRRLRWGG